MERLRTCEIYRDDKVTVFGVESVASQYGKSAAAYQLYGKVEPVAVLVCTAGGISALDMLAEPIALESLRETVPDLDGILKKCSNFNR